VQLLVFRSLPHEAAEIEKRQRISSFQPPKLLPSLRAYWALGIGSLTQTREPFMVRPPVETADSRALRAGVAFVWLATGLGVLHPFFREQGTPYLRLLGLPDGWMYAACAGEVVLGLCVLLLPARSWLTAVQVAAITAFTVTLAAVEPGLLVNPFGVLSKNVSLLAFVAAAWLLQREGWTRRAGWVMRFGLAFIWVWEGLFANAVFQSETLRAVIAAAGLDLPNPRLFLAAAGSGEALGGVAILVLRGRPLRWLLVLQTAGLLLICILVTNYNPLLWFHPFGPLTKNIPLIVGTLVLLRRVDDPGEPAA
jgi:hypothetical protein